LGVAFEESAGYDPRQQFLAECDTLWLMTYCAGVLNFPF